MEEDACLDTARSVLEYCTVNGIDFPMMEGPITLMQYMDELRADQYRYTQFRRSQAGKRNAMTLENMLKEMKKDNPGYFANPPEADNQ